MPKATSEAEDVSARTIGRERSTQELVAIHIALKGRRAYVWIVCEDAERANALTHQGNYGDKEERILDTRHISSCLQLNLISTSEGGNLGSNFVLRLDKCLSEESSEKNRTQKGV
jgi:hypothetical protein